ncbi:MAG: ABC transporter substrate-binding protein [Paracoccaceae bacterium]|nr:ABC transporter substrate-binding protein [Paracoccaceae bacterium]
MRKLTSAGLAALIAFGATSQTAAAKDLVIGFSADAATLDPANHRDTNTETIIREMYDGILTRDPAMHVVPQLAESYKQISPTVYEFKIRKGVKFHDGGTMTAEDVKFTLDRIWQKGGLGDGQTSPRQSLLGPIKSVDVVNGDTVRVTLSAPWSLLPAMLPFQEIVSKAFVDKVGTAGMATQEDGTGPFQLVQWNKGDSVVMKRFDAYWGGKACVDRVIFKTIPESSSRVAALLAGDAQIIDHLPPYAVSQVNASGNAKAVFVNGTRSYFIAMNLTEKPFTDIRVREAIAHAIDKPLVINKILGGHAVAINGILSPDAFGKNKALKGMAYDPALSRKLLKEAGYPDGIKITMDVTGPDKDTAEAVASLMAKGGITTKVQVGESAMLGSKWRTMGKPKTGDMFFSSWGNGSLDPQGIFMPTHHTDGRGNASGYSNPKVDKLLDDAAVEVDRAKRAAMYEEAEAIAAKDVAYIYLWVPQDIYGVSKRLTGWQPSPDGRLNLVKTCLN